MDTPSSDQARRQLVEPLGSNQQKYGTNMSTSTQNSAKPPYPWNLTRFYNMNDAPWVPKDLIPNIPLNAQSFQHLSSSVGFQATGSSFQNYRSRPLPSDCDTTCNDDSGYGGSRPPYSNENTSVYDDDPNPEAHNAAQLMDAFHLDMGTVSSTPVSVWPQSRQTPSLTGPSSDHKYFCQPCKTWLRTKSELNKHGLRHNKPFRCDVASCSRKEGFGTRNDLDRHRKSVHSDLTVSGIRYICTEGQCRTRGQSKLWPRADNFRSHLRRIHQKDYSAEDNLEEYIYRDSQALPENSHPDVGSITPNQPALREDLQGVGGTALSYASASMHKAVDPAFSQSFLGGQPMMTDSRHGMPDLAEDLASMLQSTASPYEQKDHSSFTSQESDDMLQSDILKGAGQGSLQTGRSLSDQMISLPSDRFRYPNVGQEGLVGEGDISLGNSDDISPLDDASESLDHDDEQNGSFEASLSLSGDSEMAKPESEHSDIKMAETEHEQPTSGLTLSSDSDVLSFLQKNPEKLTFFLKHLPKDLIKNYLGGDADDVKSSSSIQDSANQKNPHVCPDCHKEFNRQCELKKHIKRHTKPYGCTFEKCTKSFGSKNDWKRHESSQHWQLEKWKCEEIRLPQKEPCERICHRRESFRNHLQKEHSMSDAKKVEERLDRCRIGRHCDPRFWCGFCRKIIQIEDESANAWTKRCDHIDNHFCGRDGIPKRNISEWEYLNCDDEKGDKDHLGLSTQPCIKQSSSSPESCPPSDVMISTKRKLSADTDASSHKRQRQKETHDMWACCGCKADMLMSTSSVCYNCDHPRCQSNCIITRVVHRSEEMR